MSFVFKPIIGSISLFNMMAYFFIFAFLGWIVEVVFATLKTGKFVNRGFLNGPVCPIYGVGIAFLVLFLNSISGNWLLLFLCGTVFATLLEFITGFVLDKLFHTKWWDYSKEPFNIKGYVCLRFSLLWGIAVVVVFLTLIPITQKLIDFIPDKPWGVLIICVFWAILICDIVAVVHELKGLMTHLKEIDKLAERLHKNSDALGEKISDATLSVSNKLSFVSEKIKSSRLGKAFPKLLTPYEKLKDEIEKIKDKHKK